MQAESCGHRDCAGHLEGYDPRRPCPCPKWWGGGVSGAHLVDRSPECGLYWAGSRPGKG